jgi:hypothetical protein
MAIFKGCNIGESGRKLKMRNEARATAMGLSIAFLCDVKNYHGVFFVSTFCA